MVGGTVVTCQTYDVQHTLALACGTLAHTVLALHTLAAFSTQEVTCALPTVASGSIPEIATLADATVWALCVVKAFPALSGLPVAGVHI